MQTVLKKFLISMVLLGSIAGCTSQSAYQSSSITNTVGGPYNSYGSAYIAAYNFARDYGYKLTPLQKRKQTHAIYSALDSEYGDEFRWYEGDAMGIVKSVHGYPQGSGFCRVVYTTLVKKNNARNFSETACKETGHQGWRFIVK